jgi:histidinol phosphatase-like PHP family hydrolase
MTGAPTDINARVSGVLRAVAAAQTSKFKAQAFRRAAAAVMTLDRPLDRILDARGELPDLPNVGPASRAVILDVLRTGASGRMEREVAASRKASDIRRAHEAQDTFLSATEVRRILDAPAPAGVVGRADYRGDFQMHSTWSDGAMTLAGVVKACRSRGYAYAAVTDHSHGLKITRGITPAGAARQHRAIDALNRTNRPFRLLKGIEANIMADGSLDVGPEGLRRFEMVLAAPHSQLRLTSDQTARMVRAVTTPGVHVLAHPRGRQSATRAGILADWDRVFAEAASTGVAIEIDGTPARQDIDHTLAARALAAGCLLALDSDAHTAAELAFAETALAHARLAGVPSARIVNCWPLEQLLAWLTLRRTGWSAKR